MEKAKGVRAQFNGRDSSGHRTARPPETAKTLKQLGLTRDQSSRWQQLAENPKAVERYLRDEEDVPTTAGALAVVFDLLETTHGAIWPPSEAEEDDD